MTAIELFDQALALVGLVLLITAAVLLGIWIKSDGRRGRH